MILKTKMVVAMLALLLCWPAWAEGLRIATIGAFPPFNMKNSRNEIVGFDVDLTRALCHQMSIPCDIVAESDAGIVQGLLEKKYDAVIATRFVVSPKLEGVDFTDSYYSSYLRFLGLKDSELTTSVAGLAGKTLAALSGSASARHLARNHAARSTIELYDSLELAFADLQAGKLDAVLANVHAGYDWLTRADSMGFDYLGEAIDSGEKTAIAVRKGDNAVRDQFNSALQHLLENGTYQRINRNYFPFNVY